MGSPHSKFSVVLSYLSSSPLQKLLIHSHLEYCLLCFGVSIPGKMWKKPNQWKGIIKSLLRRESLCKPCLFSLEKRKGKRKGIIGSREESLGFDCLLPLLMQELRAISWNEQVPSLEQRKRIFFSHWLSVQVPAIGYYRSSKCTDIQKMTGQIYGRKNSRKSLRKWNYLLWFMQSLSHKSLEIGRVSGDITLHSFFCYYTLLQVLNHRKWCRLGLS